MKGQSPKPGAKGTPGRPKSSTRPSSKPAAKPARPAPARSAAGSTPKKRRIRTAVFTRAMKVGFLRRFYVKRLLRYIEKSRKKGRSLPPDLAQVERMVARLPPKKQVELLETALLSKPDEISNRQLRRAAGRQDRLSGSGAGNRPGSMRGTGPRGQVPGR
jgi:hypothetical protein